MKLQEQINVGVTLAVTLVVKGQGQALSLRRMNNV
ncbi:MAG: hypothetical protein RIR73_2934 [Chloroflexota bacterium]